uniref:AMP-binding enzyme C-terminal domain-containing protein n=1 Tax=Trichuris muris TaxID=70415 RepID=A0A5S6Q760_TRIMR
MTECAPATITKRGQYKVGSVGQPAPSMEVKVVNSQSDRPCRRSEVGEIWIRGPTRMIAYLHNPEATKATVTADGWVKTGDMGYLDSDDHLYVVDRIKELIKYKSKQVAPTELENVLLQHPAIKDAAVIGIPKAEVGEIPRAYICLKPGCSLSEEDVHTFIEGKLAPHKWLRGGVRFVENIPHSCNGKVQRKALKEQAMLESAGKNGSIAHQNDAAKLFPAYLYKGPTNHCIVAAEPNV